MAILHTWRHETRDIWTLEKHEAEGIGDILVDFDGFYAIIPTFKMLEIYLSNSMIVTIFLYLVIYRFTLYYMFSPSSSSLFWTYHDFLWL